MQSFMKIFLILTVCMAAIGALAQTGARPPAEGGIMPEILLSVPQSPDHQRYLGVTGKSTFTIPEIDAEVVIIEIFSMY